MAVQLTSEQMNYVRNINAVMDMLNRSSNIMSKLPICYDRDMTVANIKDAMRRAEQAKSVYTNHVLDVYA